MCCLKDEIMIPIVADRAVTTTATVVKIIALLIKGANTESFIHVYFIGI